MKNMKRNLTGGMVSGLVGGILMMIALLAGASSMGLKMPAFFLVMGMSFGAGMGSAVAVGLLLHYIVALVAGAIFGVLTFVVKAFRIKSGRSGLMLGLIYGIVVYLVFFLPMALVSFAPVMMKIMGPMASQLMGSVLVVGLVGHIIYGLTLGGLSSFVVNGFGQSPTKGKSSVRN